MNGFSLNELTWAQVLILHVLDSHGPNTVLEVTKEVDCPRETVRHGLIRLTHVSLASRERTPPTEPRVGNLPHTYAITSRGKKLVRQARSLITA